MTLGNLSTLEAIHIVLCTVGVLGSSWCCYDAFTDWLAVRRNGSKRTIRLVSAWMCVRIEAVRVYTLSLFLYLGILAAMVPPSTRAVTTHALFIRWLFILSTIFLCVNSVLDVRARRRIIRYLQDEERAKQ